MQPLYLVTGFLGGGKTTLLRRLAERYRGRRVVFLVNEFSTVDVDGVRLADSAADVVAIPGGSIFCKCLVGEFISRLKDVAARWGDAEGVIVEASGMANPSVIDRMLTETGLDDRFRLAGVITVVDPAAFLKLRQTLPNILDQVRAADVLLVNKIDRADAATLEQAEAGLQELNPHAPRFHTVQADADLDLFTIERRAAAAAGGEYAACRDPRFRSYALDPGGSLDAERLTAAILAHAEHLYRLKGRIVVDGLPADVDFSAAGISIAPLKPETATGHLAVIFKGESPEQSWSSLREALAAAAAR